MVSVIIIEVLLYTLVSIDLDTCCLGHTDIMQNIFSIRGTFGVCSKINVHVLGICVGRRCSSERFFNVPKARKAY